MRESEWPSLLRLAFPLILVNVANQLMGLVDTILAGWISPLAQGAVGLGNSLFFAGGILGMGITMGIDPLTSQAFGAGRRRAARRVLWQGIYTATLITLPMTGLVIALTQSLGLFGITGELAGETRAYIYARLPALIAMYLFVAARAYLQSAHRTLPILVAAVVGNIVNFAADWALIYGIPSIGLPSFGVPGIAWSSTVVVFFELGLVALAIRRIDPGPGDERLRAPDGSMIRRVLSIGIPSGLQLLTEIGIFTLISLMAGGMGTHVMAAHQVSLVLASLTFMVPLGIASATCVQVGRSIGAHNAAATRRAGISGIGMAASFMFTMGLVMWLAPGILARLMTSDPEVARVAEHLIRIAGTFQVFDGIQVVAVGALRGAGITRWSLGANLVGYWLLALPVAWVLAFVLDFGAAGLWWGLTIGLAVVAVAATIKFLLVTRRPIAALELDSG